MVQKREQKVSKADLGLTMEEHTYIQGIRAGMTGWK